MNIITFVFLLFIQLWYSKKIVCFLTFLFLSIFFRLRLFVQIVLYIKKLALGVTSLEKYSFLHRHLLQVLSSSWAFLRAFH